MLIHFLTEEICTNFFLRKNINDRKEQELLKNIMLWGHVKSEDLAMLLVKGIDLEDTHWKASFLLAKKFLPKAIEDSTKKNKCNTNTKQNLSGRVLEWASLSYWQVLKIWLYYIFYTVCIQIHIREVESLDVFKPEGARVRFQKLLSGCSINDNGKPS